MASLAPARTVAPPTLVPATARRRRTALVLTGLLAADAVIAAGVSLLVPSVLRGAAVTDGNLRGTSLVVLVVGVPLLLLAGARGASRSSVPALVAWLAGATYLTYQAPLFCFATPMNRLFPAYVAMLGLGVATVVAVLRTLDLSAVEAALRRGRRALPALLGTMAVLNALAWLARAVPIVWTGRPPASVTDSGLLTNPVLVLDLAFWLPLSLLVSVRALRRLPWGNLATVCLLAFFSVEGIGVATDQWWGVRADPDHPAVASMAVVAPGVVLGLALAGLVAWALRPPRDGDAS